jgi:AAA domain
MRSLNEMAHALGGEISAGQILCPGPGHQSPADRSLAIRLSDTAPDGFVVHSFADDPPQECRDHVRRRLGLPAWAPGPARPVDISSYASPGRQLADAFRKPAAPSKTNGAAPSIDMGARVAAELDAAKVLSADPGAAATYQYRNAAGELLYEVLRLVPKSFRQRRPDGNGGYSYKLGDVERVLYRLPELLAYPDATTFVVEGEKDANRLADLGLCATTISGGSSWTPEIVVPLAGRDVFVVLDNDAAGFKKAEAAAKVLHGVAKSVRLVLLPDLADKGDVSDWLSAGNTKEQLLGCCLAAPVWNPASVAETPAIIEPELGEWDAGDDEAEIPPRGWLLGNVFCRRFVSSLIADGGTGKTALRIAQLLSLATGRNLTGEHVFQRCRVLIVSLEDNAQELRRRIRAACLQHGIDRADLRGWLFLSAPGLAGGKIMTLDPHGRPIIGGLAAKLARTITVRKIDIVSLDPFVKSHGIEENNNSMIDDVVQVLSDLGERFDTAVDVLHHAAKGSPDPGNPNRGRGASSMKDAIRLLYTLSVMTPEEGQAFGLSDAERRLLIRMDSAKVNITPPMADAKWFKLVGVDIGNGTELYPNGDSVQTVEVWLPPDSFAGMGSGIINQILTAIDAGMPDGNRYSDGPRTTDRAVWRVVEKYCPGKTEAAARRIIKTWTQSGLLIHKEYENPATRKQVKGLFVDNEKRPS